MTGLEERMDLKLQAVEQRLERKIVNTSLINVVATCTILGLVITRCPSVRTLNPSSVYPFKTSSLYIACGFGLFFGGAFPRT